MPPRAKRPPGRPAPTPPSPVDPTPETNGAYVYPREGLASVTAAALFLAGISRDAVYDMVARGELPAKRMGTRIGIPWKALHEFAEPKSHGG